MKARRWLLAAGAIVLAGLFLALPGRGRSLAQALLFRLGQVADPPTKTTRSRSGLRAAAMRSTMPMFGSGFTVNAPQ